MDDIVALAKQFDAGDLDAGLMWARHNDLFNRSDRMLDVLNAASAEIAKLRSVITMMVQALEDWEEPDANDATRQWCDRFGTYLRGCVVARAAFEPEQWSIVKTYMGDAGED